MRHDAKISDTVDRATNYSEEDLMALRILKWRDDLRKRFKRENELNCVFFVPFKTSPFIEQNKIDMKMRLKYGNLKMKGGDINMTEEGERLLQDAAREAFEILTPILDGWDGTSDLMAMISEAIQGMPSFSAVAAYFAPGQTVALVAHVAIRALPQLINLLKPLQVAVQPA